MKFPIIVALAIVGAGAANAASVTPTFTFVGAETTTAQATGVYRADLTGLGLTKIGSITVTDDNTASSGAPGAYSGFDLDALFLDLDGDYTTTGDQIYASSFVFSAGSIRAGDAAASNTTGPLNGMNADGTVDESFATLNAIDALFFDAGSISLGDGGALTANFAPEIAVPSSLFLIVGEVGNNGESIDGSITISEDPQVVPLPAGAWLLLSGLGALCIAKKRKKKA